MLIIMIIIIMIIYDSIEVTGVITIVISAFVTHRSLPLPSTIVEMDLVTLLPPGEPPFQGTKHEYHMQFQKTG
jgi:hypothetical protein